MANTWYIGVSGTVIGVSGTVIGVSGTVIGVSGTVILPGSVCCNDSRSECRTKSQYKD